MSNSCAEVIFKVIKYKYKKLYVIDLVCHGVPSPQLWKDYINYLEKKCNSVITKVQFRDKKYGWKSNKESFKFKRTYIHTYIHILIFFLITLCLENHVVYVHLPI